MVSAHSIARCCSRVSFIPVAGQVKGVMGDRALGVNQRHLNTATLTGEDGADGVQKSGTVLGDDFQQRAARRTFVVEAQAGFDLELGRLGVGLQPRFQQALQRGFADQDFDNRLLEALATPADLIPRCESDP